MTKHPLLEEKKISSHGWLIKNATCILPSMKNKCDHLPRDTHKNERVRKCPTEPASILERVTAKNSLRLNYAYLLATEESKSKRPRFTGPSRERERSRFFRIAEILRSSVLFRFKFLMKRAVHYWQAFCSIIPAGEGCKKWSIRSSVRRRIFCRKRWLYRHNIRVYLFFLTSI